jgi:hypothetical protein
MSKIEKKCRSQSLQGTGRLGNVCCTEPCRTRPKASQSNYFVWENLNQGMTPKLAKGASCRDAWQVSAREILERRTALIRSYRKIFWLTTRSCKLGIGSPPDHQSACAMTPLSLYHPGIIPAAT